MADVHAPYNFVPLSALVVEPEWANLVTHDLPFSDGICGSIELELQTHTPVCVGGRQEDKGPDMPFMLDGKPAIPGTAIKGMLRNVLEIATFSKMGLVDRDRRYAVRDLYADFYRNQMTQSDGKRYSSKVKTGWLSEQGDNWFITPCKMSRVEQEDLLRSESCKDKLELKHCFTSRKVAAAAKYKAFGEDSLDIKFDPEPEKDHKMSSGGGSLVFSAAANFGKGKTSGRLVFTGQPSPNKRLTTGKNSGKHREFIFYEDDKKAKLNIPGEVRRDFVFNHAASEGERHAGGDPKPNEEWKYWKNKLKNGEPVPVFFLGSGENVDSIGLAFMYRLAYKNSIGDSIDNVSKDHDPKSPESPLDMAELIFGRVVQNSKIAHSLRGRANVGLFKADVDAELTGRVDGILNAPKPTYFPAYIKQITNPAGDQLKTKTNYITMMDDNVRPRGWKRYPVREKESRPPETTKESSNVKSSWRSVAQGSRFRGRIHVHNLRPEELGALLWAIDFGGRKNLRHSLGKAKPFGFGAVSLRLTSHDLRKVNGEKVDDPRKMAGLFADYMGKQHPCWEKSEQISQLLAMADPVAANGKNLNYMKLEGNSNPFADAKKSYKVLPPYSRWKAGPDAKPESSLKNTFEEKSKKRRKRAKKRNQKYDDKQASQSVADMPMPDGYNQDLWIASNYNTRKEIIRILKISHEKCKSTIGEYLSIARQDETGHVAKAFAHAFLLVSNDRKWVEEKFGKKSLPARKKTAPQKPARGNKASFDEMCKLLAEVEDAAEIPKKVLGRKYRDFKNLTASEQKKLADLVYLRCVQLGESGDYADKWKDVAIAHTGKNRR